MLEVIFYHIVNCLRLTVKLLYHARKGFLKSISIFGRLCLFAIFLIPLWCRLVYELVNRIYTSYVIFSVPYTIEGSTNRNLLDIYLPYSYDPSTDKSKSKKYPVIVLVSGGAWIIGYKLWSFIIAMPLATLGCIVVVPDYRNFPQGSIEDMMSDIRSAMYWVDENIEKMYGGDKVNIVLAGQSAGAHISMCVILEEFKRTKAQYAVVNRTTPKACTCSIACNCSTNCNDSSAVSMKKNICDIICMFVGISGPYDIISLCSHLHRRGLDSNIVKTIFNNDLMKYSPTLLMQEMILQDMQKKQQKQQQQQQQQKKKTLDNNRFVESKYEPLYGSSLSLFNSAVNFISGAAATTSTYIEPPYELCNLSNSTSKACNRVHFDSSSESISISPYQSGKSSLPDSACGTWCDSYHPFPFSTTTEVEVATEDTEIEIKNLDSDIFCDFPAVFLYHGMNDKTIPHYICIDFGKIICDGGGYVRVCLIPEWSHTDGIVEAPLKGDNSLLVDILRQIDSLPDIKRKRMKMNKFLSEQGRGSTGSSIETSSSVRASIYGGDLQSARVCHETAYYAHDPLHYTNTSTWFIEDFKLPVSVSSHHDPLLNTDYQGHTNHQLINRKPNNTSRAVLSIGIPYSHHLSNLSSKQRSMVEVSTNYMIKCLVNFAKQFNPFYLFIYFCVNAL